MNFVAQVEGHLRDLGTEARKKHPGVKEASERGILQLRLLQNAYVVAVRRATAASTSSSSTSSKHPTTATFASQDVLRPFLLACNYPDASTNILDIALDGMQLLLLGNAICREDGVHMGRVLAIQAHVCASALSQHHNSTISMNNTTTYTSTNPNNIVEVHNANNSNKKSDNINNNNVEVVMFNTNHNDDHQQQRQPNTGSGSAQYSSLLGGLIWSSNSTSAADKDDNSLHYSYSSSTGGLSNSHIRNNWKEEERIAIKLLQTVILLVESLSVELTEEVLKQCFIVSMVLRCTGGGNIPPTIPSSVSTTSNNNNKNRSTNDILSCIYNIRKNATATTKKILFVLFRRTASSIYGKESDKDEKVEEVTSRDTLVYASLQTFHDLIRFASKENSLIPTATLGNDDKQQQNKRGPLWAACVPSSPQKYHHPPTKSTCLYLIHEILLQRLDLFTPKSTREMVAPPMNLEGNDCNGKFVSLVENELFPLILQMGESPPTLLFILPSTSNIVTKSSLASLSSRWSGQSNNNSKSSIMVHHPSSSSWNDMHHFMWVVRWIRLSFTLFIRIYGDGTRHVNNKSKESKKVQDQCFEILSRFIQNIRDCVEGYRKSDVFDDGYSFMGNDSDLISLGEISPIAASIIRQNIKKTPAKKSDDKTIKSTTSKQQQQQDQYSLNLTLPHSLHQQKQQEEEFATSEITAKNNAVSNQLLWKCALSVEILYQLLIHHLDIILWLEEGTKQNILSNIVNAIGEFASIVTSFKGNILHVVATAHAHTHTDGNNEHFDNKTKKEPQQIHQQQKSWEPIFPMIQMRATNIVKSYDEWDNVEIFTPSSSISSKQQLLSPSKRKNRNQFWVHQQEPSSYNHKQPLKQQLWNGEYNVPSCDLGEAVWVALNCIFSISQNLSSTLTNMPSINSDENYPRNKEGSKGMIDSVFAPSLSVLQHFLKRFAGSDIITRSVLSGYVFLANATIPSPDCTEIQQKAIITSLCKFSVPSWGKPDLSCYLSDHHIATFSALIQIVHNNCNNFSTDWRIFLSTMEQISSFSISSPCLSEKGCKQALEVFKLFPRVSTFSTCFSDTSLNYFLNALIGLSSSTTNSHPNSPSKFMNSTLKTSFSNNSISNNDSTTDQSKYDTNNHLLDDEELHAKEPSLGGKIISFAGRALLGTGGGSVISTSAGVGNTTFEEDTSSYKNPDYLGKEMATTTRSMIRSNQRKTYAEEFYLTVCDKFDKSKPITKKEMSSDLPFSLVMLTDVIIENAFRFASNGKVASNHLRVLASTSPSPEIRLFAIDSLANLTTAGLNGGVTTESKQNCFVPTLVPTKAYALADFFTVEMIPNSLKEEMSNKGKKSKAVEELQKRHLSLANTPHGKLLRPLCETITMTRYRDGAESGLNALHTILEETGHNLSGEAWSVIIDAISTLSGCENESDTSSEKNEHIDRSTSEWSVCSALAFRCLKLIVDDFLDELPSGDLSISTRTALLDCCAAFGSSKHDVNTSLTATGMLWTIADQNSSPSSLDHVLLKLAHLASDERVEVRNCSVNTLFSCLVGIGHKFSEDQWQVCLNETIFGVLSIAISKGKNEGVSIDTSNKQSGEKTSSRYRVALHHSRDSTIKQWTTTQVLILRGLERVLRHFFDHLLVTSVRNNDDNEKNKTWFESGWLHILNESFECSTNIGGRETLAVRLAGVDLLIVCLQLSSQDGIDATKSQARVGTNMQVVNGALRSVRTSNQTVTTPQRKIKKKAEKLHQINEKRYQLFLNAFEILVQYRTYLNDKSIIELENLLDQPSFIETPLLQVLTRLGNGLTKLYECCKNNEMAPTKFDKKNTSIQKDNKTNFNIEKQMVDLVTIVMRKASAGGGSSRFLTQGQRICLELLQIMASNSSSTALESLAAMGGSAFFRSESSNDEEKLEYEIAHVVSQIYENDQILHKSKVIVLNMILSSLIDCHSIEQNNNTKKKQKLYTKTEGDGKEEKNSAFNIMVNIFQGGLRAADSIDKDLKNYQFEDENDAKLLLENVWTKSLSFLHIIIESEEYNAGYMQFPRTNSVMKLLSIALSLFPKRMYDKLGNFFSFGVTHTSSLLRLRKSQDVSQEGSDENMFGQRNNELAVFKSCFQGLCKCLPDSKLLQSCTGTLLLAVSEDINLRIKHDPEPSFNVNDKIAISICKTITETENLENLAVRIFPHLSNLVNAPNKDLRIEISAVFSKIDMERVLKRMEAAELYAQKTKKINDSLCSDNDKLSSQLQKMNKIIARAENAETLSQQLLDEVERLKSENEELERQVAIFSEGSAYT